jgi:hypothetical protein
VHAMAPTRQRVVTNTSYRQIKQVSTSRAPADQVGGPAGQEVDNLNDLGSASLTISS